MAKNIFVTVTAVTLLTSSVYSMVWAQTPSFLPEVDTNVTIVTSQDDFRNDTEEVSQKMQVFTGTLDAIDIRSRQDSDAVHVLNHAFVEAAEAIISLEKTYGVSYAELYREQIQEAISQHMQRPGALHAVVSINIDSYSKYLTETLIAEAGQ